MVTDKSIFASERIKVVEFNRHFKPEEQDINLKAELTSQESMSGIFMWMIRGYIKYKQRGLTMAPHLKKVVRQYEKDNDLVLQFLEARCETSEDAMIKAKDLYNSFKIWAKSEGAPVLSARKFNSEMERHMDWHQGRRVRDGYPVYYGIKMRELL